MPKTAFFPMILVKIREIFGYKMGGGELRALQATLSKIRLKKGGLSRGGLNMIRTVYRLFTFNAVSIPERTSLKV